MMQALRLGQRVEFVANIGRDGALRWLNSLTPPKRGEGWLVAPKLGEGGGAGF
jgi:hypothetical protein